jgi:hypothetical protein
VVDIDLHPLPARTAWWWEIRCVGYENLAGGNTARQ